LNLKPSPVRRAWSKKSVSNLNKQKIGLHEQQAAVPMLLL